MSFLTLPRLTKSQRTFVNELRAGRRLVPTDPVAPSVPGRPESPWVGHVVRSRPTRRKAHGRFVGVVIEFAKGPYCGLEGCTGRGLIVRWEDRRRTTVCTKGLTFDETSGEYCL